MKKAKNLEHIIQKCDLPAIAHPFYKVQVQFPAYIHILHNPKIKTLTITLSRSKVQKVEEERNQVKANRNLDSNLNHLPLPQKRNIMKRQTAIIIMRIVVNKAVAKYLKEVPNKGEGASKTIIGANTKATMDNSTPPMEAITIIIIMVIIEAEVDVSVVVIITEVMAAGEVIIEARTITNTTNITHMVMAHRWSNMAHHAHFALTSITLLSIVLKESMT